MSLVIDLSRFRRAAERVERTVAPTSFDAGGEEFRVVAPVVFGTDVRKDGLKFRLVGGLTTTLEATCSRCLEPFAIPVVASFDLLFLPAAEADRRTEHEIKDDDVGVSFYKDDEIDLADVMREQFYLVLPMKPLCKDECRGLCPVCGINRNTGTCDCKADWVDPRMQALKDLQS